jgi:hypothetical protein
MSGVSLPVTRPTGRALVVGQPACRAAPMAALQRQGFACIEVDQPYDAMMQLCRRPLFHSAMILSLHSLYREELPIIASVKRRFPHIEIWLADTDGRQAALAEAMRLGADGLVNHEGLHRMSAGPAPAPTDSISHSSQSAPIHAPVQPAQNPPVEEKREPVLELSPPPRPEQPAALTGADPVLTAEELRALLQETPVPRSN